MCYGKKQLKNQKQFQKAQEAVYQAQEKKANRNHEYVEKKSFERE